MSTALSVYTPVSQLSLSLLGLIVLLPCALAMSIAYVKLLGRVALLEAKMEKARKAELTPIAPPVRITTTSSAR